MKGDESKLSSKKRMSEISKPIKSKSDLITFEDGLRNYGKHGIRMLTLWTIGKTCLLRVSDVIDLKYYQVFNHDGSIKSVIDTQDMKTRKQNRLHLKPSKMVLKEYRVHLNLNHIKSKWLFPNLTNPDKHISRFAVYQAFHKVANDNGIAHVGSHSMRKTGAYLVYSQLQTPNRLTVVQHLLNQSNSLVTCRYLDIDSQTDLDALKNTKWY